MATAFNGDVYIDIKELPQVGGIERGDLLIVETQDGTNIMDFDDMIIDTYQTTFYSALTSSINSLTVDVDTITEDLSDLTAVVDVLGGTAFTALSSEVESLGDDVADLTDVVDGHTDSITSLTDSVNSITANLTGLSLKAYGYVQLGSGTSPNYITTFTNYSTPFNVSHYQHVRRSSTVPGPTSGTAQISPAMRVWNIVFAPGIPIAFVDIQFGGINYSSGRAYACGVPILSSNASTYCYYTSVSSEGPGAGERNYYMKFMAF